jgi:hypothetical protein
MTSTIVKGNKETKTFAERLGISSKHITTATKQGQALYAQ